MADATTTKSVAGSFETVSFSGKGPLFTMQAHDTQGYSYWATLDDGSIVVSFSIGGASFQLSPEDAEHLGLTIAAVAADAQAYLEAQEVLAA